MYSWEELTLNSKRPTNNMKLLLLTLMTSLSLQLYGQNLADHLQECIADLAEGESIEMEYAKTGSWGSYEGGKLIFTLNADSIKITLSNTQNYLGAKTTNTSSDYDKDQLLDTLEENKKSFTSDPDNIVIGDRFQYRIIKNGEKIASGSSALEPGDVVNKVALSNALKDSFLKKQKGLLKNNGVFVPKGIKN